MKKLALGILALILTLLSTYAVWVQFPRVHNPKVVQAIRQSVDSRHDALVARANDPESNGYLNPAFLGYWGRRGIEMDTNSAAGQTVRAWNTYSSEAVGNSIDHNELWLKKDENYLEAFEQMVEIFPEYEKATNKELFFPPNAKLSLAEVVPNYISYRATAQAANALAAAFVARGDLPLAINCLLAPLRMGRQLLGQGDLINNMIGITVQSIASDGLLRLVDVNAALSAEQWQELAGVTLACLPPDDTLVTALEGEFVSGLNNFEFYRTGELPNDVRDFPGLLDREIRIYCNIMESTITQIRTNGSCTMPGFIINPKPYDWLSGKVGLMSDSLLPSYERAGLMIEFKRNELKALATAYGVSAYRAETGALPQSLSEIPKLGIPTAEDTFLTEVTWNAGTGELRVPVFPKAANFNWELSDYSPHPWVRRDSDDLIFIYSKVNP